MVCYFLLPCGGLIVTAFVGCYFIGQK
jgi:protein-S-isoprenylcysteine O-methyltransferase Ste14